MSPHRPHPPPPPCLRLVELQNGVIASWPADSAGLSPRRMEVLVRHGRWQRLHYGVYASFTGVPPRDAVLWAAVLRVGPQSMLSHEPAAELDGLLDKRSKLLHVTILVPARATDRRNCHPPVRADHRSP